jgi:hypothetical protein
VGLVGRRAGQADVGGVRALLRVDVTNAGRLHTARRPMNLIPLARLVSRAFGPVNLWQFGSDGPKTAEPEDLWGKGSPGS